MYRWVGPTRIQPRLNSENQNLPLRSSNTAVTHVRQPLAVAAGIFLRTFHQCLAEGNVVRSSVVALLYVANALAFWLPYLLWAFTHPAHPPPQSSFTHDHPTSRVWRTWSLASGADVTWGALDAIAQAVEVAPWELEEPEVAGLMELPEAELCVRVWEWCGVEVWFGSGLTPGHF